MASYKSTSASMSRPATYGSAGSIATPAAPPGTFAPGTKIQVGGHKVVIQKYFSEGGFAHVYLVKMPKPIDGTDIAVLKRVAVPDKDALANMRTEVETMKKLKGHRPIVTYYDSHASQMKGGGYEVFLLMEFCNGGGLIDFMNTRLQNRLTEPEILKIFSDVAEGVACMHYLKPPLLHRDLKVENVLISTTGTGKRFKLCDFGSTAPPRPAGSTPSECRLIEDDVQKHTTLQYRSPEMIDVYRKQPIDEKSDIWALGVLLYKLCYYTTPFEEQGQLAILNASFKYPAYPPFSNELKVLIASMLKENPRSRPNIYQILRESCLMQKIAVPIKDIYATRTESEARRNEKLPPRSPIVASPPVVGAVFSPPVEKQQIIPDIAPMRRGRLAAAQPSITPNANVSPTRGTNSDPFAALDAKSSQAGSPDEIADRFPSLDQFTLLHDHGKFEFGSSGTAPRKPKDLSERVTERLADDAFKSPPLGKSQGPFPVITQPASRSVSKAQAIISSTPSLQSAMTAPTAPIYEPTPSRPGMVSTGTMTSPSPTPPTDIQSRKYTPSPIYRFPPVDDHLRSNSLPREQLADSPGSRGNDKTPVPVGGIPKSSTYLLPTHARHSSSSRPSLEGGRPTQDLMDPPPRTKSSDARPRPSSTYLESNMDYLREKESMPSRPGFLSRKSSSGKAGEPIETDADDENAIASNVEFLRTMEEQNESQKKDRRRSSLEQKSKRSSLPSMSLSGTKTLLAGRFGDAFKRFEGSNPGPRTPSPLQDMERRDLTPIAGSEATDGRSDDGHVLEDSESLGPEQRREIERRRLSMEEKRVADAAKEYRQRLADRDAAGRVMGAPGVGPPRSLGGVTRASTIQNKVKNLLDESQKVPATKTAEGYGRFTATSSAPTPSTNQFPKPVMIRKPLVANSSVPSVPPGYPDLQYVSPQPQASLASAVASPTTILPSRAATIATRNPASMKPSAPPKPTHLNSVSTGPGIQALRPASPLKPSSLAGAVVSSRKLEAHPDMTRQEKEDYIEDFSKRFPSLSGIEMVEADIGQNVGGGSSRDGGVRTREV